MATLDLRPGCEWCDPAPPPVSITGRSGGQLAGHVDDLTCGSAARAADCGDRRLRLVIDTDTASDDAVALMLAALDPAATIEAVTTVAGNVGVEQGTTNALYTLELAGNAAPVFVGLAAPLLRELVTAEEVHGEDGMGDIGLPMPTGGPEPGLAPDVLRELAEQNPGELTLVTLGPLSNVAAALATDPELLTRYKHTYIMGGALDAVGNVTACGEFNFWADPEAAQMVMTAPGDKTLVGWNVARLFAVMTPQDQQRLRDINTPFSHFVHDINRVLARYAVEESGLSGYDFPDPLTMAIALDPSISTRSEDLRVRVSTSSDTRGLSFADRRSGAVGALCTVVWEADEQLFKEKLFAMCVSKPVATRGR